MTTSEATVLNEWTRHPLGKTVRIGIAVVGLASSGMVLLLATMSSSAVWFMVVVGVSLAATSVRAAIRPNLTRLGILTALLVAVPFVGRLI